MGQHIAWEQALKTTRMRVGPNGSIQYKLKLIKIRYINKYYVMPFKNFPEQK